MPLTQVSSRLIEDTLRYVLGASGTNHYTFTGKGLTGAVNDPTLTLSRGHTYVFENRNSSGAHPFYIKTSIANGGTNDAYNTGVTNNGGAGGTEIVFTVPHDAPDLLYYQCSSHSSMAGQLKIAGAVADGSITESKLADDAVTADKLANSINTAIAANTAKDLTALSASNLTSGTVPDARFPATLPAVSGANLTNLPANRIGRNLIINGAMQVAQRGTSSTSGGYQTVDRIEVGFADTDENPTQSQVDVASGTTPYTSGFRKAYRITNGNQTSGAGTSDIIDIKYAIESQDIANSGWNYTSSSSYITLSFWVKSSVAQNFFGHLVTNDGTSQNYPFETGSLSADTWTKVTKTISGNSNLQFDNDTGKGLEIRILPFGGTARTASSATLNQWAAYDGAARTPDNTSTWYTTNDATFEITGVQLEVGSVATDFEHLSFADNLRKCQRYCQAFSNDGTQGGDGALTISSNGTLYAANVFFASVEHKVSMRAKPSLSITTGTNYYVFYTNNSATYVTGSNLQMNQTAGTERTVFYHTTDNIGTSGHGSLFRAINSSAKIIASAEL